MTNFPTTRKELQQFLQIHGLPLLKMLGQNFLIEPKVCEDIVSAAEIVPEDNVLEIGCGIGHLTQYIVPNVQNFWGVEIDKRFYPILKQFFSSYSSFHLLECDILNKKHNINPIVWNCIEPIIKQQSYKIIANLPYNVSAPVLMNFLKVAIPPKIIVVTIQKEVAQRFLAQPNTEFYGPISILAQLRANIEHVRHISPQSFVPPPKVYSSVIKMTPKSIPKELTNETLFEDIVRSIFNMKRKTIFNSLKQSPFLKLETHMIEEALELSNISIQTRGEILHWRQIIQMTNHLERLQNS
ncbi:MAG TPA: 16S rRNA (adenine(1518)-N(6)/adenine(1519)-N(6))-dimethyltransferase RsmA, partial [Planctomycetota bacterium]|nr:16S rRNA (adenine(1518)-N(6)/adenine(1519)-N(6))-dimethyltransferase RsmA [Planctomycetota bacterium]